MPSLTRPFALHQPCPRSGRWRRRHPIPRRRRRASSGHVRDDRPLFPGTRTYSTTTSRRSVVPATPLILGIASWASSCSICCLRSSMALSTAGRTASKTRRRRSRGSRSRGAARRGRAARVGDHLGLALGRLTCRPAPFLGPQAIFGGTRRCPRRSAPAWTSTSELGYHREPPRHRADTILGTTSRRWRNLHAIEQAP